MKNEKHIGRDEYGELIFELTLREKAGLYGALLAGTLAFLLILLATVLPTCTPDTPEPAPAIAQKGQK